MLINLPESEQFKVDSLATGRIVTVVGLYIEKNKVMGYEIKDEGYFCVSRFRTHKETMEERLAKVEKKLDRIDKMLSNSNIDIRIDF